MPIDALCPAGHRMVAADNRAGQVVHCPICNEPVKLPAASSAPVPEGSVGETRQLSGDIASVDLPKDIPQALSYSFDMPIQEPPIAEPRSFKPAPVSAAAARHNTPSGSNSFSRTSLGSNSAIGVDLARTAPVGVGYRADRVSRRTVYKLSLLLMIAAALSLIPLFIGGHWNPGEAPTWASVIVLLVLLQFTYVAWMVSVPDWGTAWVVMIVHALVTSIYTLGFMLLLTTPTADIDRLPLDLSGAYRDALPWCALMTLLFGFVTYVCARVSYRWHKKVLLIRYANDSLRAAQGLA